MWNYSEKVMEHFLNPRNVGEVENPDAVGEVGNITCGDALRLTLKLDQQRRIVDARFQTFGCASAIASSSALTELIKGMTLEQAARITNRDLAEYLDGLPEEKMHCSVMGMEALEAAIASYKRERGEAAPPDQAQRLAQMPAGEIVCRCFGVTDTLIERVARENQLATVEQVTHFTKAGGGCGSCHADIQAILDRVVAEREREAQARLAASPRKLTNLQRIRLIEETIEREIRPSLRVDGGDIELVDVEGDTVKVALRGHCAGCVASTFTLKLFVEEKLREFVEPELTVEEVKTL
ncbi:MAG: Fe-S cluster assembly protein NifU [Deltaproteobacteria bacterium]|nr:Fe-S cluster assembly protein NifU [Deltaproteobacteria bacterium]